MNARSILLPVVAAASAIPAVAQAPELRVQATARPGQPLQTLLVGTPLQLYATLLDVSGGPLTAFGQPLWLSLTPALTVVDYGALDAVGSRTWAIPTPAQPALAGAPLFFQSLVLDQGTPRLSNGQSAILHRTPYVVVHEFRDPVAD